MTNARGDWERRIGDRSDEEARATERLPAPANLRVEAGIGQATLRWEKVEGAMGYLVHRATTPNGPFEPVDHGGGDVLAVPAPPYADTTGEPGRKYWYAVAAMEAAEAEPGNLSAPVGATSLLGGEGGVALFVRSGEWGAAPLRSAWGVGSREKHGIEAPANEAASQNPREFAGRGGESIGEKKVESVPTLETSEAEGGEAEGGEAGSGASASRLPDPRSERSEPVWRMIGSEHLSQLFYGEGPGGHHIGEEFEAALRMAHEELGATHVRAHAIFHDELGVYREVDGEPRYDFSGVERVYDKVLGIGLKPVVELSFMPRGLALDPEATVFEYKGVISPPRDWERWGDLNRRLAAHLVERYGVEEVSSWGFEVWNEANLDVFWTGTREEYFRLYDVAARAMKSVDERLLVGGPSTAAAEWVPAFLDFAIENNSPLDFISTHTYGNLPLDVGEALKVRGMDDIEIWWTEWGATPTHFNPINDSAFGGPFVLHGMKSAQNRADALAYWVISDHFEELGRGGKLFHGGFGLLTYGNLKKPRYHALALAEELGPNLLPVEMSGDGAGSLVDAWAGRDDNDGSVSVLVWNGTLDQSKQDGDTLLDRRVEIRVEGLEAGEYRARLARVDRDHSNPARRMENGSEWPSAKEWEALRKDDAIHEEELPRLEAPEGVARIEIKLPMPGVARLRLDPA